MEGDQIGLSQMFKLNIEFDCPWADNIKQQSYPLIAEYTLRRKPLLH